MIQINFPKNATLQEVIKTANAINAKFIIITRDHYTHNFRGDIFPVNQPFGIEHGFYWSTEPGDGGIISVSITNEDLYELREYQVKMRAARKELMHKYNRLSWKASENAEEMEAILQEVESNWRDERNTIAIDLSKYRGLK